MSNSIQIIGRAVDGKRCYGIYAAEYLPRGGRKLVKLAEVWAWNSTEAQQLAQQAGYWDFDSIIEL